MAHRPDAEIIATTHNTARFFTENRQISWVALLIVIAWGIYGYQKMPKRKDPDIPVKEAQVICAWPGVSADRVEQLVTRKIEQKLAEVSEVRAPSAEEYSIKSLTLDGLSVVNVQVDYNVKDLKPVFNEMDLKLRTITDLPKGAGPIQFFSGFGDTAALMLTVASPKETEVAISLRAKEIAAAIKATRGSGVDASKRATVVVAFPMSLDSPNIGESVSGILGPCLSKGGALGEIRPITGKGFVGLDGIANSDDELLPGIHRMRRGKIRLSFIRSGHLAAGRDSQSRRRPGAARYSRGRQVQLPRTGRFHRFDQARADRSAAGIEDPDLGRPAAMDPSRIFAVQARQLWHHTQQNLAGAGGAKYRGARRRDRNQRPQSHCAAVGRVQKRKGRRRRNYRQVCIPVRRCIFATSSRSPAATRIPRDISTTTPCATPPADGRRIARSRVPCKCVPANRSMLFGENVDHQLALLRQQLPSDLIMARTSDQPRQVEENVELLNHALEEAIVLVVITALIGFWEWRSALLMAVSMPLTLLMTFGFMDLVGWDIQQVSIASLIIALGLLIDDPVVAGDAIKRDLDAGHPRIVSAWLGPTKLARAILYATITNIVAYLPFGLLSGDTGKFIISLPVVMTASLIASRLVSMTFIPMLGYYWLRPAKKKPLPIEEQRRQGFTGYYYRTGHWCLEHRWLTLAASIVFLVVGFKLGGMLKSAFFPIDLQFLSTVDIFLPNDSALSETTQAAAKAREIIQQQAHKIDVEESDAEHASHMLKSLTTFVGGSGPRFWYSLAPEPKQVNYAQVVIEIDDRRRMSRFAKVLQPALTAAIPGAYVDVQELQTNGSKNPIEIFVSGRAESTLSGETEDIETLRKLANKVEGILRAVPDARRVRNDWFGQTMVARLEIDPDRANLAGISNEDVAASTTASLSGTPGGDAARRGQANSGRRTPLPARARDRAGSGKSLRISVRRRQAGSAQGNLFSAVRASRRSESAAARTTAP